MSDLGDDWTSLPPSERQDRIRAVLGRFRSKGSFYIDPQIPENKLATARTQAKIPSSERVIGLIDCTVFGSAKNSVVFGERALYYHNGWTVSNDAHRGASSVAYERLANLELTGAFLEVRIDGGTLEVSGSTFTGKEMLELLASLQSAILCGPPDVTSLGGCYIAPHLVTTDCLEPTNEVWPNGITTCADASVVAPPFRTCRPHLRPQ